LIFFGVGDSGVGDDNHCKSADGHRIVNSNMGAVGELNSCAIQEEWFALVYLL
jgi:hypothetical protein